MFKNMKIESHGITHQGMVRARNEDSFYYNDELNLYVVADGMGGHRGGDIASRIAINEIEKAVREWPPKDNLEISNVGEHRSETEVKLITALKKANKKIYTEAENNTDYHGMGTTTTGALVTNGEATIAHVGDSRAYLIRDKQIRQITEDHSWVNEQVKAGFITNEEARTHRLKNLITRSLGHEPNVKVDVVRLKIEQGDRFLLCSDGLSNLVHDEELRDTLINLEPTPALERLVEIANERGGYDNITAVMIEVRSE